VNKARNREEGGCERWVGERKMKNGETASRRALRVAVRSPNTRRAIPIARSRASAASMAPVQRMSPIASKAASTAEWPRKYMPNQRPLLTMNWLSKKRRIGSGGEGGVRQPESCYRAWQRKEV